VREHPPEVRPHRSDRCGTDEAYNLACGSALMGYKDREQQRAYQLAWVQRRRGKWIAEHGPCAQCGSWDRPEVDHVDRAAKAMEPARIWSLSAAKREAELARCQVLCHDCHLDKTRAESTVLPPHGTRARYARHGEDRCRCQLCRDAATQYERERREGEAARCCIDCGGRCSADASRCRDCQVLHQHATRETRIDWPPADVLAATVADTSFAEVGRRLGVSDNAVRKHMAKERRAIVLATG